MNTKTIIVASLLSALTLPVFAQTGAAAAPAKTEAAKTEAAPKAKHHVKHKKSEKKAEAKTDKKEATGEQAKPATDGAKK